LSSVYLSHHELEIVLVILVIIINAILVGVRRAYHSAWQHAAVQCMTTATCAAGLLPFMINNLRSPELECKTAALRLVWLTLAAQVEPSLVEAAYLSRADAQQNPAVEAARSDALAETFMERSFTAAQEMLQVKMNGKASISLLHSFRALLP